MEIKIGVQHTPREVSINATETRDQILAAVRSADSANALLELTDQRGRSIAVPIARIAYIEFEPSDARAVGFDA